MFDERCRIYHQTCFFLPGFSLHQLLRHNDMMLLLLNLRFPCTLYYAFSIVSFSDW